MPSNAQSVSARRAKAITLIQSGLVHSQSDLVVQVIAGIPLVLKGKLPEDFS